jgi:serine/threonine protein phosphatase 1
MTIPFNTFAIGDVHGRADLLSATLSAIAAISVVPYRIVFLGDIVDRGPDSKKALDLVMAELVRQPESILLRGNHEDLMLRFVTEGAEKQGSWLMNGGEEALASYGYRRPDYLYLEGGRAHILQDFCDRLQSEQSDHFTMLRNAADCAQFGDHIFVHAGIDPTLPLDSQDPHHMRWTKETPDYRCLGEKTVVHGHVVTRSEMPEMYDNRIAIDTGAYVTGRLTTMLLRTGAKDAEFHVAELDIGGRAFFEQISAIDLRTAQATSRAA